MSDPAIRLNVALKGRYRIEGELGEGGMATVYLADDLKHERKVALKVLKPELAAVVGAERFLAEIKTTANLQHPHILPLFDSGEVDGFVFYVMPYVEGESLRERLDREHQLPVDEAVRIATDVADALQAAHDQGVIHRDIKPANILLSKGRPLVADFGIALAVSTAGGGRLTETGLSLGTPHYMSPEQAMGDREIDARSDVYSLAAVLYEMLAGEPPYQGSSAQVILARIITSKVGPVSDERDTVPAHIDAALAKALNRTPADRFATASAFADALTNPAFTLPSTTFVPTEVEPKPPRSRRVAVSAGVGALAALALVFLGILGGRLTVPEGPEPLTRFRVTPPEGVILRGACCGPVQALSPDGEWLVFIGFGPNESQLYRRRLGQLEAEEIPGTEGATIPFFSPDGRWLGFHSEGRLRKVPMTGGPPVPIAETSATPTLPPSGASWGDDDLIVFAGTINGTLYTVPAAGGVPSPVPSSTDGPGYAYPWMLPGGEAALMTVRAAPAAAIRMVVVDLETGAVDTLGFGTRVAYASGHLVFSGADGTLLAQPFDPDARRTTGQSVAILDGVAGGGAGLMGEFALSAEGGLAYESGGSAETLMLIGTGGPAEVRLPEQHRLEDPAFSPDGRRIAMRFTDLGESRDIWIFDRDQETLERLTDEGTFNQTPVWTPDGARIAFSSQRDGERRQLYWQPADGSGPAEQLLATDFRAIPGSWSPDGRTLAFQALRGSWDVGLLTLGDSTPRWLLESEFDEVHPQLSPNGQWLAYTSDRSGEQEVYVEATSGEGARYPVSTNGGHSPRWAPDGSVVYFGVGAAVMAASVSTDDGFRVTSRVQRFDGVDDLNLISSVNYDVHPDGEEFVYVRAATGPSGRPLIWILNWLEIVGEMTSAR